MRRIQRARFAAQALLRDHGIKRPPVDIHSLAKRMPKVQTIEELELDDDLSGALMPVDAGKWLILVNASHSKTRRRFTVAHELGHLVLHQYTSPHADRRMKLRDARSSEGSALEEIEANQFASELLMPRDMILKAVGRHILEYEPENDQAVKLFQELIAELAEKFNVSPQAMTIRLSTLFA